MGPESRSPTHQRTANKEIKMSAFIWYALFFGLIGVVGWMLYLATRNLLCVTGIIHGCK